jgi:uncharacterized membrane protein YfcA
VFDARRLGFGRTVFIKFNQHITFICVNPLHIISYRLDNTLAQRVEISMSVLVLVFLVFIAIATSVLSGTIGMGGGIVLLSIMTLFMPLVHIIPVHGVVQLVSNTSRFYLLREHIKRPAVFYFALGLPFGGLPAFFVLKEIENKTPFFALIILLILYALFKPKKLPALKIPMWGFLGVGIAVGFLSPLVGATGPFIAPFFLRDDFTKENIVATKASVQALGHLLKFPIFFGLGFDYLAFLPLILGMTVAAIVGTKLGIGVLKKINPRIFTLLFKSALAIAAVRLLWKMIH